MWGEGRRTLVQSKWEQTMPSTVGKITPTKPHKSTNSWKVWETCRYCRVTQRDYVQSFRVDFIYRTALNHCCRWRCHRLHSYLKCHSLNKLQQFNVCDIEEMTQVWSFSDHSLEKSALWVMLIYQNLTILPIKFTVLQLFLRFKMYHLLMQFALLSCTRWVLLLLFFNQL